MILANGNLALLGESRPIPADLRIEEGRIAAIGRDFRPGPGEELIDASGLLVLPGAIDPHVHFDTPGFETRESFLRGSAEAARGGVTTVIDMPCTSLPPVVNAAALENKLAAVAPLALVDYGFYGGVRGGTSGDELERGMAEIADRVLGFKAYLLSGMETFPQVSHQELKRALAAASELDLPLLLHAEDANYCAAARARVAERRAEGEVATWDDYVDSRPREAELLAGIVALELARELGCPSSLHVVHVGVAELAEALARAGATCETCAHYLAFSREDFALHGASLKTAPPVKEGEERERLWTLLAAGTIPFITSDHAPSTRAEKRTGSVWTDYGGIPGTGTLLPYLLSEGYLAGRLSLPRFLEAVSSAAAKRYGIDDRKGSIGVGKDADLVLIDAEAETLVSGARLYSKGRDTPFEGMALRGKVQRTYVRGRLVYDAHQDEASDTGEGPWATLAEELAHTAKGIVAQAGWGRFITRSEQ